MPPSDYPVGKSAEHFLALIDMVLSLAGQEVLIAYIRRQAEQDSKQHSSTPSASVPTPTFLYDDCDREV